MHALITDLCSFHPCSLLANAKSEAAGGQPNRTLTCCYYAIEKGQVAILRALLAKLNNVQSLNDKCGGWTPLHCACHLGLVEAVRALVVIPEVDVNARSTATSCSAFTLTALNDKIPAASKIAIYNTLLSRKDFNVTAPWNKTLNRSLLHVLATRGDTAGVQAIIEHKSMPIDAVFLPQKWTPLHLAAFNGRYECVDVLVKAGANVQAAGSKFETPLYAAYQSGNRRIVLYLRNNSAVHSNMGAFHQFEDATDEAMPAWCTPEATRGKWVALLYPKGLVVTSLPQRLVLDLDLVEGGKRMHGTYENTTLRSKGMVTVDVRGVMVKVTLDNQAPVCGQLEQTPHEVRIRPMKYVVNVPAFSAAKEAVGSPSVEARRIGSLMQSGEMTVLQMLQLACQRLGRTDYDVSATVQKMADAWFTSIASLENADDAAWGSFGLPPPLLEEVKVVMDPLTWRISVGPPCAGCGTCVYVGPTYREAKYRPTMTPACQRCWRERRVARDLYVQSGEVRAVLDLVLYIVGHRIELESEKAEVRGGNKAVITYLEKLIKSDLLPVTGSLEYETDLDKQDMEFIRDAFMEDLKEELAKRKQLEPPPIAAAESKQAALKVAVAKAAAVTGARPGAKPASVAGAAAAAGGAKVKPTQVAERTASYQQRVADKLKARVVAHAERVAWHQAKVAGKAVLSLIPGVGPMLSSLIF